MRSATLRRPTRLMSTAWKKAAGKRGRNDCKLLIKKHFIFFRSAWSSAEAWRRFNVACAAFPLFSKWECIKNVIKITIKTMAWKYMPYFKINCCVASKIKLSWVLRCFPPPPWTRLLVGEALKTSSADFFCRMQKDRPALQKITAKQSLMATFRGSLAGCGGAITPY